MTNTLLVGGTLVIGIVVAALQGVASNPTQFVVVALMPMLGGAVAAGTRRIFGTTNFFRWMFVGALAALAAEVIRRLTAN